MPDSNALNKFGVSMERGLWLAGTTIGPDLDLERETYNVTSGLSLGLAPRYGMVPMPGHNTKVALTSNETPGLAEAEGSVSPGVGLEQRSGFYGIHRLQFVQANVSGLPLGVYYAWFVDSNGYYALCFNSTYNGSVFAPSQSFARGLTPGVLSIFGDSYVEYGFLVEMLNRSGTSGSKAEGAAVVLGGVTTETPLLRYAISSIAVSVSGPDIPAPWLIGKVVDTGGATEAPSISFQVFQTNASGASPFYLFTSAPGEWNLANYSKKERKVIVTALKSDASFNIRYRATFDPTAVFHAQARYGTTETHINLGSITATKLTAGTGYSSSVLALYNDNQARISSSYKAVLAAANKPIAWVVQDWALDQIGNLPQVIDLTSINYVPYAVDTTDPNTGNPYTENEIEKNTAFQNWPSWEDDVWAETGAGPHFGDPNSGLLRINTSYELTYSLFNKRLNYESNVGRGVRFWTGDTNDFQSLIIWDQASSTTPAYRYGLGVATNFGPLPFPTQNSTTGPYNWDINNLQYRFYYRPLGTYQWLPCLQIDAPNYWYNPQKKIELFKTPVAGLPGGQPGGFIDYSMLPQDKYSCVLQYKNRIFWFSPKAIYFSISNNIFAYPANNSVSAIAGEFRGGILHNYPGQAEQNSRLIIFGTKETYVARFTGRQRLTPVQVSPDSIGEYPQDGSDFIMDPWTSVTAFSSRSAVVADGLLYWWGPQGIYFDDGTQTPVKLSKPLEPDIAQFIEDQFQDGVFAHYNGRTKEISWFYTPKGTTTFGNTHALIYNTETEAFHRQVFRAPIDNIGDVDIQRIATSFAGYPIGARSVAISRTAGATTQRGYFFDQNNLAGDQYYDAELLAASVTYPTPGNDKLIRFATDPALSNANFATLAIGDYVSVQSALITTSYADSIDAIGVITAINSIGTKYIEVTFETDLVVDPAVVGTVSRTDRFPLFQKAAAGQGLHGIPWRIESVYWAPNGLGYWAYWLYIYLLFRFIKWSGPEPTFELTYRTPVSGGDLTDTLTITDNSAANCQIYHPLAPGDMNMEGQGLKLTFSGIHIGHRWVLHYLEAHAQQLEGEQLKIFEG